MPKKDNVVKEAHKTISVNVPQSVWKQAKHKCLDMDVDLARYVEGLILADCSATPVKV